MPCPVLHGVNPKLKKKKRYTLKNEEKFKDPLFIDDLKICAKSECEVYRLVSTVQMFRKDIGMEFRIKCGVRVLRREKVVSSGRIKDVEENDKLSMYFRIQQNQGKGRIFVKNEINHEKYIQ